MRQGQKGFQGLLFLPCKDKSYSPGIWSSIQEVGRPRGLGWSAWQLFVSKRQCLVSSNLLECPCYQSYRDFAKSAVLPLLEQIARLQ